MFAVAERRKGKVRIVFGTLANYKNISLNDVWLKGPDMTNCLRGVLLRFREHPIAFMADINKSISFISPKRA